MISPRWTNQHLKPLNEIKPGCGCFQVLGGHAFQTTLLGQSEFMLPGEAIGLLSPTDLVDFLFEHADHIEDEDTWAWDLDRLQEEAWCLLQKIAGLHQVCEGGGNYSRDWLAPMITSYPAEVSSRQLWSALPRQIHGRRPQGSRR